MRKKLCGILLILLPIFYSLSVPLASAHEIGLREITVTIFVDSELFGKDKEATIEQLHEALDYVSRVFEKEFQLTFYVKDTTAWEFSRGREEINALDAWNNLELLVAYAKTDIALGITKKKPFLNYNVDTGTTEKTSYRAFAPRLSQSAVVMFDSSLRYHILHEFGHLFGADHNDEPDSIMSWNSIDTKKFDEKSKYVIRSWRNRSFPYQ